jgi:hypothetical protein
MTDSLAETPPSEMDRDEAIRALRAHQNFAAAIPAGLAAALVGAVLWAAFVYLTGIKLGLIALAIGAMVGLAVRKVGHGLDPQFGVLGGVCAALGWALGTVLCDVAFIAKDVDQPFFTVLANLGIARSASIAIGSADFMDIVFLAIAVYEGYKLAFRYRLR